MTVILICFIFLMGFIAGWLFRESYIPRSEKTDSNGNRKLNYHERQIDKVLYKNDLERIRELNLLTHNQSKFMRILQHQFTQHNIIVKDQRFYITDKDHYPFAIFEYQDGTGQLMLKGKEDGLNLFLYKAILSSEAIAKDKRVILGECNE